MKREHASCVALLVALLAWPNISGGDPAEKSASHPYFRTRLPSKMASRSVGEMEAVVARHRADLLQIPGVYTVFVGQEGIIIGTIVHSQTRHLSLAERASAIARIPTTIEGIPVQVEVGTILPPPPGVIILRPGSVREQAETCPEGSQETTYYTWRFCMDKQKSETLPALIMPPIARILMRRRWRFTNATKWNCFTSLG